MPEPQVERYVGATHASPLLSGARKHSSAIERGGLVDVLEHPNQERYPGQMIYVVNMDQYLYLVPFATAGDGTRFLKTIIPSRKATRDYQRRLS